MFQRKPRRFRRRTNGRNHLPHGNGHVQNRMRSNSFSNGQGRNNFRPTQSAEKLYEKYSSLAKEAMSSGDKTLGENYLQHADHFIRIIKEKNKNREQIKTETTEKTITDNKSFHENNNNTPEELTKNKE